MTRCGMPLPCTACGSERTIVLVHSLRLLCGACMHQWNPDVTDPELPDTAEAAAALSRLLDRLGSA